MTTAKRRSINVESFGHVNPIPAASRIGGLVMSSVISGRDRVSGRMPPTIEGQCAEMFRVVREIVEAAGGTPADIIKMTVWLRDPGNRDALNAEWVKLFPEPGSRPARHTLPLAGGGDSLIQCDITAVIDPTP
ncbi:MAG: RidA family protein [Chloroflexi bacterium]|nr:RidA family protein [Chloroflexota bacterium]MBV9601681.1 RidA family protein [Chloroflexota bacterium]